MFLQLLLAPVNLAFSAAIGMAICLCLLQLLAGIIDLGDHGDLDLDIDADGHFHLLDFLHVGRLPVSVSLTLGCFCFGLVGLGIQQFIQGKTGAFWPIWAAVPTALLGALPPYRAIGLLLTRILPSDETEAVTSDSLVGREARITAGTARRGLPAEARVHDAFGKAHYVQVEPTEDDEVIAAGKPVLLLTRHGHVFRVIDNSSAAEALEERAL